MLPAPNALRFHDILPHLVDSFRRGVLVPFIGSGMSRPACQDWRSFLLALADESGVEVAPEARALIQQDAAAAATDLYRLADRAVRALRTRGVTERAEAYRRALNFAGRAGEIPRQTRALARLGWPMVLSTNYDDLYVVSRERQPVRSEPRPEVLGRSVDDCQKIIRALSTHTQPSLWALQGFLGGQAAAPNAVIPDERRRHELVDQLVVGHQQYQNVINSQPHFRRAFAEVFHRRSLLFMGSGILEDYLVNLFGEIIHHYGPGPHPHFALVPKAESASLDPQFLQTRLGIAPIFYDNYQEIPAYLDALANVIQGNHAQAPCGPDRAHPVAWFTDEIGLSWADGSGPPPADARRLRLRYAPLCLPKREDGQACSIVSVGRAASNMPILGSQANVLLDAAIAEKVIDASDHDAWTALDKSPSYVFRLGDSHLFAIAARVQSVAGSGDDADRRDLGVIPAAVSAALTFADRAGFRSVYIGPVASGRKRLWHPLHPFIQMLVGIRQFFAGAPDSGIASIVLHVVDPSIWYPVLSNKIPVSEILSSDVTKIWVDIRDQEGSSEFQAVTVRGPVTVAIVKALCGLKRDHWTVDISPWPSAEPVPPDGGDALLVAPTSFVTFMPCD